MQALTLKEIHNESLHILKDIHNFCILHNIKYSIAYGTLLGAIRHKGFIPWDDDIDIIMTRKNYNKFTLLYQSENYEFVNSKKDPQCWIAFGRVCDIHKTTYHTSCAWYGGKQKRGLWVDVFPIDNAPDNTEEYLLYHDILKNIYTQLCRIRRCNTPILLEHSWKLNCKILKKKITHLKLRQEDPHTYVDYINYLSTRYNNKPTQHMSQLVCIDNNTGYFETQKLTSYTLIPFEDTEVMAFSNYDYFLKQCYGDYLTIPSNSTIKSNIHKALKLGRFYWR